MSTEKDTQTGSTKRKGKGWDFESEGSTERDSSSWTERAREDTVDRMKV